MDPGSRMTDLAEWRVVADFPRYEVSSDGRVRRRKTGRVLRVSLRSKGYAAVTLMDDCAMPHKLSVHRIVAGAFIPNPDPTKNILVDHIDRNKLNNNVTNLRWAAPKVNAVNRGINKNNTSGVTGVYYHKPSGKWMAFLRDNGEAIYLGTYDTIEEAEFIRAGYAGAIWGDIALANNRERDASESKTEEVSVAPTGNGIMLMGTGTVSFD